MRKLRLTACLAVAFAIPAYLVFAEASAPTKAAPTTAAVSIPDHLRTGIAPLATTGPEGRGLNLLQFDDGVINNGTGCNANPPGQVLMHFGGAAATTGLVPFQLRGLYWQIYPGFEGVPATISANVWYPLSNSTAATPYRPTNTATPFFQAPAITNTAAGFKSVLFAGPTISSAQGNVLAGVGVNATAGWFVAYETSTPSNRRFGACGTPLAFYFPGGANVANDAHIRLLVDGSVPVELMSFSVE